MNTRHGWRSGKAAGYLLMAVLGGFAGAVGARFMDRGAGVVRYSGPVRPYTEVVDAGRPVQLGEPVVQVARRVGPAVVKIDTALGSRDPFRFSPEDERSGEGSGFIINSADRLAVTNNHVVEGARQIQVTLSDKRVHTAQVVGTDPVGDIALIRLDGNDELPEEAKFADSDRLEIGQIVVAIGNPLGFEHSVTQGVLSATGRKLDGRLEGIPMEDLIQTDAAINPGNSGGPLLDAYGRVIGMNTAIISRAQGIGFAVAANSIKRASADILQFGRVRRSWLGVSMRDFTPIAAQAIGMPTGVEEGVLIQGVRPGEPAERGGLSQRDVITRANAKPVKGVDDLRRVIRGLKPGEKLTLAGFRDGEKQQWTITLGEMPEADTLR